MTTTQPNPESERLPDPQRAPALASRRLSLGRLATDGGVVIFLILLMVAFSVTLPDKFPTVANFQTIFGSEAVPLMLALAVMLPLIAGEFDLSVAGTLGAMSVYTAYASAKGWPVPVVFSSAVLIGCVIGSINGFLVTKIGVSAFIATLGMGTLLGGGNLWMSGGYVLYAGIPVELTNVAGTVFLGLPLVVYYAVALALILWYLLELTPMGRYLRATGSGREAARLTGVRTERWLFLSFVIAAMIAAFAGFMETSRIGSAPPDVGPNFLLPAYAAAFLGATTIHPGRFNVWGTVVGVLVLAIGITGLNLAGAAVWVSPVFNGGALVVAVSVAVTVARRSTSEAS